MRHEQAIGICFLQYQKLHDLPAEHPPTGSDSLYPKIWSKWLSTLPLSKLGTAQELSAAASRIPRSCPIRSASYETVLELPALVMAEQFPFWERCQELCYHIGKKLR